MKKFVKCALEKKMAMFDQSTVFLIQGVRSLLHCQCQHKRTAMYETRSEIEVQSVHIMTVSGLPDAK